MNLLSDKRWVHHDSYLLKHGNIYYWTLRSILKLKHGQQSGSKLQKDAYEYSVVDPLLKTTSEIHPIQIYHNMLNQKQDQSLKIYDTWFEYKNLRKRLRDRIFELGEGFRMDNLTIHLALKYLEIMLHFINFYQRNNRGQKVPSDPKPVKEAVPKTSPFYGKDTSHRIKALAAVK